MRIEVGKTYQTRAGKVVHASNMSPYDDSYVVFSDELCRMSRTGWYLFSGHPDPQDIVAEVPSTLDDALRGLGATLPADDVQATLQDRQATHGDFAQVARYAQARKRMLRAEPGWDRLTDVQCEALDLDATKEARLMCGDPSHADTWLDKAGYARLGGGWKP